MVDQKKEAKKEKFIETMPTMIQSHLIICKDWADVKDKANSLEHIIRKCDPPTLAMPLVTTGATVPGLYLHIAHSVDKEEGEIPPPFKGAKLKQTRGRGNLKENLRVIDKTHQKPKRQMKTILMIAIGGSRGGATTSMHPPNGLGMRSFWEYQFIHESKIS